MIKNLVFDLGNVLVEFKPKDYMERLGFPEDTINDLYQIIFKDERWSKFDIGDITIEEYVTALKSEHPDLANRIDLMFSGNWPANFLRPKPQSIDFLNRAHDRYGIYVLSNVSSYVLDYVKSIGFWDKVSGGTYSYAVKSLKPDSEIYKRFFNDNGVKPEECLFLDDLPQNIEAAKKAGMHGIVFNDNYLDVANYLIKNGKETHDDPSL